jgi:HCOMODA/2-hydroxy-3-carboxy-muconic semialdehyde decarboxylase
MSGSSFATALDDLALASSILYHHKIVDGYGHISARDPRDSNRFLLSRAKAPGLVTKDDILTFGLDGQAIERKQEPVFYEGLFIQKFIARGRTYRRSCIAIRRQ